MSGTADTGWGSAGPLQVVDQDVASDGRTSKWPTCVARWRANLVNLTGHEQIPQQGQPIFCLDPTDPVPKMGHDPTTKQVRGPTHFPGYFETPGGVPGCHDPPNQGLTFQNIQL